MPKSTKKYLDTQQKITMYFGYGLFSLALVGLVLYALPWVTTVWTSRGSDMGNFSSLIAFGLATVIPPLIGYYIGDEATRAASRRLHHYNGVLFGILGFWIATLLMTSNALSALDAFLYSPPMYLAWSILPAFIALVVLMILGRFYARSSKRQHSLLVYRPYQVTLLALFGLLLISSAAATASGVAYGTDFWESVGVLLLPMLMVAFLAVFGALVIGARNGGYGQRLTKSLVALSFAAIMMNVLTTYLVSISAFSIAGQWAFIAAAAVWVAYIILLRRTASSEK